MIIFTFCSFSSPDCRCGSEWVWFAGFAAKAADHLLDHICARLGKAEAATGIDRQHIALWRAFEKGQVPGARRCPGAPRPETPGIQRDVGGERRLEPGLR